METIDKAILFGEIVLIGVGSLFALGFTVLVLFAIRDKIIRWIENLPEDL